MAEATAISESAQAGDAVDSRRQRTVEASVQCGDLPDHDAGLRKLEKEKESLRSRLEFVEELVGPTEAQRKILHEQITAARHAALRAKYRGANVPTKVTGRLDERMLWSCGLSERDVGLLQGGCLPDNEGILQDVSLLGDPQFKPYDEATGDPRWHARGGMLQLSLGEVRNRFGIDIAEEVVRCAKELDKYDASRRVGVELPWHPLENRELEPAEVIDIMERELNLMYGVDEGLFGDIMTRIEPLHVGVSPYAAVNAPPRRGRAKRTKKSRAPAAQSGVRGGSAGVAPGGPAGASAHSGSTAVILPRVDTRSGRGLGRCELPAGTFRTRMQDSLEHPLLQCNDRCTDRIRLV
eukprot:gnl/TRDRNA2_/TRDRNA2_43102_c0_seq2.p1 gnl/TRDRNA2_/TRDRNA2_43102_c0~~gnl/TRDRNA2_/TRDRNA2_43102_c0_seq2.p1  ORF type:complete len:352 (+),score=53.31 gnl/TRDRNA2_/TRDRNA2_43102_c0_seq2:89-1144(+)